MKPARWAELAALIVLGACGPSNGPGSASTAGFTERDSAMIVIATTSGGQARSSLAWQVDTIPDLEIGVTGQLAGDESAPPWFTFHRIGGVRQLTDGRIVVADGGSRELRYFGSGGQFLRSVGRQGRGPGEFEGGPLLVPAFGRDSLLLFDTRPIRFQFFSTEDDGHRMVRPATWKGAMPPIGFIEPNVLVELWYLHKPTTTGVYEIPATYAWTDMVTGSRTLVDSFPIRPQYAVEMIGNLAHGGLIPFSPMPAAAVKRNGALITKGALPEIKEYDIEGRLRRIIRVDEPSRQVTDTDIQHYVDVSGSPINPGIPIPEVMPTFESLLVDEEGWLWAKRYEVDPARRPVWVVFDPIGRAHGSVETPVGLRIQQIDTDFIIGVWTDELDVEHVRRYRVIGRTGGR